VTNFNIIFYSLITEIINPASAKLTVLYGHYRARTDRFNAALEEYSIGTKLTLGADGDLQPASSTDQVYAVCIGEGTMSHFQHNSGSAFNYIEFVTV